MPPYHNAGIYPTPEGPTEAPTEDPFWVRVTTILYDDNNKPAPAKVDSTPLAGVEADIVQVARQMDERGKMIGSHQMVQTTQKGTKGTKVEEEVTFPFKTWLSSKVVNEAPIETAKRLVQQCIFHATVSYTHLTLPTIYSE